MEQNLPDVREEYPASPSVSVYVQGGKEADSELLSLSVHTDGGSLQCQQTASDFLRLHVRIFRATSAVIPSIRLRR